MKRLARIKRFEEPRTGTSQNGQPWVMQDVEIEWDETEVNAEPYKQSLVVTLNRKVKDSIVKELIDNKTPIGVTFYFDTHEFNNRMYNSVRGFISREYTEDI